jgi:hypothetical protein
MNGPRQSQPTGQQVAPQVSTPLQLVMMKSS